MNHIPEIAAILHGFSGILFIVCMIFLAYIYGKDKGRMEAEEK